MRQPTYKIEPHCMFIYDSHPLFPVISGQWSRWSDMSPRYSMMAGRNPLRDTKFMRIVIGDLPDIKRNKEGATRKHRSSYRNLLLRIERRAKNYLAGSGQTSRIQS